MGMRGKWAPKRQPPPKVRSTHRFRCRECGEPFTCVRDDARFCSGQCRQENYLRRGPVAAGKGARFQRPKSARFCSAVVR